MKPNDLALRKRTQISKANRTMFIWVAASSALISFSLVTAIFLGQKLFFNEKVLAEKNRTVATLAANNKVTSELESNVRAIDANPDLAKAKSKESDQAIQVILDALPSGANSPAFGASLQTKLLAGIQGLTIVSLQVDPVVGVESLESGNVVDTGSSASSSANQITFRFSIISDQAGLRSVLTNLERSIRTINITNLRIENQGTRQLMTVQGAVYYEPSKTVELYDKAVRP